MAHTITQTAKQSRRPFTLVTYDYEGVILRTQYICEFNDLVWAAGREHGKLHGYCGIWGHLKAVSYRGKVLAIDELLACAARRSRYYEIQPAGYVWRRTSVPGLHRWHYWRSGRSRRPALMPERRLNAWAVPEEGETPIRRSRIRELEWLDDPWLENPRRYERCWKSQHKGSKSWDKPRLAR